MRITSKGQVTIPAELRARFGLLPETEVEFVAERGGIRLVKRKASAPGRGRGQRIVAAMKRAPKPAMTTEEIMALTRGE
jgi:AbrB family looped-hinge helix DNA binding protein